MHQCLSILKVITRISEELTTFDDNVESAHLGTLTSLAATCHQLSDAPLDSLWKFQSSLIPLLQTMSADLWEEKQGEARKAPRTVVRPVDCSTV